jgi:hypothetical protein
MGRIVHATKIDIDLVNLSWLRGRSLVEVAWSNPLPWVFSFDDGTHLTVECPWRIMKNSGIAVSSEDHLQRYGLPAPIDAVSEARELLVGATVIDLALAKMPLDLYFTFSSKLVLQVIPFSCGYECWQIGSPGRPRLIGTPGGGVSTCPE